MTLVLALPGGDDFAQALARRMGCDHAALQVHRFPDGEQLVRVEQAVDGTCVVLAGSLQQPDGKILALLFAADLLRELGAARVCLATPYLPYMRQDMRFRPGEAVTAASFAGLLSSHLDALVTVEPHLHRIHDLGEIYRVPTRAASAAPAIASWLHWRGKRPLLVGPDDESRQWVASIAALMDVPYAVLAKTRRGDYDVQVDAQALVAYAGCEAVIVDDIVSTGETVLAAAANLRAAGCTVDLCVCVHALHDTAAAAKLSAAGVQVASCTTATHPSNAIDVTPAIAAALAELDIRSP